MGIRLESDGLTWDELEEVLEHLRAEAARCTCDDVLHHVGLRGRGTKELCGSALCFARHDVSIASVSIRGGSFSVTVKLFYRRKLGGRLPGGFVITKQPDRAADISQIDSTISIAECEHLLP